ncbi:MAG TPA: hypothetical protein VNZ58_02245 [Thermomicrobiales bacterium]|nr:hypothetical protein [Thermomicrobiales bacterium]
MDPNVFFSNGNPSASSPDLATQATTPVQEAVSQVPGSAGEPDQSQDQVDPRVAELEARAQRAEQEAQQFRSTFNQIRTGFEQMQAEAAWKQREESIYSRAKAMEPDEALMFIRQEEASLRRDLEAQAEHRRQMVERQLGAPLFIDHLVKQHGLPDEARQELMNYGDPNVAAAQAPIVKARYQQIQNLQSQLNQLSRSNQAGALQRAGLGASGGTTPVQTKPMESTGDPDLDAMMIYRAIQDGTYQASQ